MQQEEIRRKIASLPRWHYRFDLKGNPTPIFNQNHIPRHNQRKKYFFEPMVRLLGGTLEGKRVLDLGCNAGFWSLAAIETGCDFVLGIDGRQMHVDQANLVFEANEVEEHRYEFLLANLFDVDLGSMGKFDVVLCLGLLYHVSKPMELMELISAVNTDILVIDSTLSTVRGSYFEVRHDNLDEPRDAVDYEFVLVPTKRAVHDLARQFGYSIVTLRPDFCNDEGEPDYRGAHDYKGRSRRAFMCAKESDLSGLDVEVEPIGKQARASARVQQRRQAQRRRQVRGRRSSEEER